jgi:prenylcysteine oxidase/farnesylcysteine lyase
MGAAVPSTFTGGSSPITWYNPHIFQAYPKAAPRTTFQDPIVGSGVYYTSGMEAFLSTMETNALMGKNIARLIVDNMLGVSSGGPAAKVKA